MARATAIIPAQDQDAAGRMRLGMTASLVPGFTSCSVQKSNQGFGQPRPPLLVHRGRTQTSQRSATATGSRSLAALAYAVSDTLTLTD
jgi:hypothetical protein